MSQDLAVDEAGLAQRAVAGDGDAFSELYTRYEKRAYNLCLRILGSEDDAADATQEPSSASSSGSRSSRAATWPSAPTCSRPRATPATT